MRLIVMTIKFLYPKAANFMKYAILFMYKLRYFTRCFHIGLNMQNIVDTFNLWKISAPSTCGSPDRQLNTTIIGKNYTVGSQISYQCPLGHALIGSINRTCSINGFWTDSAPSCKCMKYFFDILNISFTYW